MPNPASPQNTAGDNLDPIVKDASTVAVKVAVVTKSVASVTPPVGWQGVATHADDAAFTAGDAVVGIGGLADETATDSVDEGDVGMARITLDRRLITAGDKKDDSAFTPGTDYVTPIAALADESATDSVDEGDVGAVRMTLDRRLITAGAHLDDSAFGIGTGYVVGLGALVDDTSTDQADEGDIGLPRMTPNRELRTTAGTGTPTDKSGAITTGATSQTLAAANANRKYLIVQNISSEDMWIRWDGSAATADKPSIKLVSGASWENPAHWCPTAAITVIAATTGSKFTAWEA